VPDERASFEQPVDSQLFDASVHDSSEFSCGRPILDDWLRLHAQGAQERRVARTFVWTASDASRVLGYYSLAGHLIQRDELPARLGRGSPRQIPAVILARLALDVSVQGAGAGQMLLADAMSRVVRATEQVAARFVVVDALDDRAKAFYEHHGFAALEGLRLAQKVSGIAASLDAATQQAAGDYGSGS
jgi:GNAT superfamily N-acetyltransferase